MSFFAQPAMFMSLSGNSGSQKRRVEVSITSTPASTIGVKICSSSAGVWASRADSPSFSTARSERRLGSSDRRGGGTRAQPLRQTAAPLEITTIFVRATISLLPKKLIDQISVRAVDLHPVEAQSLRSLGRVTEGCDDRFDLLDSSSARRASSPPRAGSMGQACWEDRFQTD